MTIFYYRLFGTVKRPVATIYLKSKNEKWVEYEPYIDSGADVTLIPFSLGKFLGLKIDEGKIEKIGGIRGSLPVIYFQNKVRIGEIEFMAKVGWSLVDNVPPLLGRADIFDRFNVIFKQKEDKILFEERN